MSYRWSLLTGWRTRDTAAVVVLALTVAFLTGTVVVSAAASGQIVDMAAEYDTGGSVEYVDGDVPDGADGSTVFPVATATVAGGDEGPVTVVAVRSPVTVPGPNGPTSLRPVARGTVTDATAPGERVRLRGSEGAVTLTTASGGEVLSPAWYRVNGTVVGELGTMGALVLTPDDGGTTSVPDRGAPVRGALAFFVVGSRQLGTVLNFLGVGAGVLVAVTVYSVTRAAVRDRSRAIRVARATGAPPRHVVGVFALRGAALAVAGTALGYAVGLVLLNLVVNVAVFAGVPTTLELGLSPRAAGVLGPAYAAIVGVGALVGAGASLRAAHKPVAAVGRPETSAPPRSRADDGSITARLRAVATPTVLGWRPLVPTTVAVSVFVALGLVLASGAGAVAPMVAGGGQTVTEPGAVHPVASTVPAAYADVLRSSGTAASGELLAFSVVDGEAFLTRGAEWAAFASVSDVALVAGRAPEGRPEAVVGADLADRLDVAPGDTVTLGGSTHPAVTRVTVVGVFAGPGAVDDQMVVSLPTARRLTGKGPGSVQFVRTAGAQTAEATGSASVVTGVEAPPTVVAGRNVTVTATVVGVAEASTVEVSASLDGRRRTRTVEVEPFAQRRVSFTFRAPPPGEYALRVGDRDRTIVARAPDDLAISGLPPTVPANSSPLVEVTTVAGEPVANATVTVGDESVRTDDDGRVRLPVGAAGETAVAVRANGRTLTESVAVSETLDRRLQARVSVSPARPTVVTSPTVRVELYNPWDATVTRDVRVAAAGRSTSRSVTLAPGARTVMETRVPRQPPGPFAATVTADGATVAERTVTVVGDDRLAAALATAGVDRGGSAVGRAVATVFGNLRLLVGALLSVAAVTVIGSIAAAFASGVRARRRALGVYRATGAAPWRIRRLVVGDAVRIGAAATLVGVVVGFVAARGLEAVGVLVVYGVTIRVRPSPVTLVGLACVSLVLVAVGGAVAAEGTVRPAPARLLADDDSGRVRDD